MIISPTYKDDTPTQSKIKAADGVMGVIILLAYWAGGKSLFPEGVNAEFWVESRNRNGSIVVDVESLTDLVGETSKALGREVGQLSVSSLPVYLTRLRKGERVNRAGKPLVPVDVTYRSQTQRLTISPRNYQADHVSGLAKYIPEDLVPRS